jgi:major vault protein
VRAINKYTDAQAKEYQPGESFVIKGPCEFIPPINVEILSERKNIQLSHNEGIYVQRRDTGQVRLVQGPQTYCLEPTEELWQKELEPEIEGLLFSNYKAPKKRADGGTEYESKGGKIADKSKVITYQAAHNTAVQLFDQATKQSKIVWGPNLIMIEPHQEITMLALSGDVPKREGVIKTLCLELGLLCEISSSLRHQITQSFT